MTKKINIIGSLAYDNIITSDKPFSEILDTSLSHQIQGAFYTISLKKEFGGCAGNIAYSLNLAGVKSNIFTSLGSKDAQLYLDRLSTLSLNINNIQIVKDEFTAQAHIINDLHNNQIISFYPGALENIINIDLIEINPDNIYILAPEYKKNILNIVNILHDNNCDFIFDPGQSLSTYKKEDLLYILPKTSILILNDFELKSILKILDMSFLELNNKVRSIIITKGSDGVTLIHDSNLNIYAYPINKLIDPTGCGDAFRSGFIYGLINNFDYVKSCMYGNALASFVAESHGTQNHTFTTQEIIKRYNKIKVQIEN